MALSSILLDTHVLLWILTSSKKLRTISSLKDYPVWTLSPVSFLEIKFLGETGKIDIDFAELLTALQRDDRFLIDSVGVEELCRAAFDLVWTRDPFDRLLVAHSIVRGLPLATADQVIRKHYASLAI